MGGSSISNLSGDKTENSNGSFDYWMVKTDASGNIQWQNSIGGSDNDALYSLKQTTDGGFIMAGFLHPAFQAIKQKIVSVHTTFG